MSRLIATANFSAEELACRCGKCVYPGMNALFLRMLQALREAYNESMPISSAYRCPEHNARVSSTGTTGPHTTGRAVDIRVSGAAAYRLVVCACQFVYTDPTAGRDHVFSGIGVSQKGAHGSRFIHLDTLRVEDGAGTRPWIWSY